VNTPHNLLINLSVLFPKPTGISTYILNLLPYLKSLEPTLLTANIYPDFTCYSIPNDLAPDRGAKGHLKRLLWTQFKLSQIYQKLNANLLFSPLPEAPINSPCRFVVMVHDLIPLRFPSITSPLTHYFRYYVPQVLQQAKHIICNSQATAKDISEYYRIPASKITPIPLAYDNNHFRPVNTIKPNIPYFLYLGRPNPYKNLPRLITAFAQLPRDLENHHLWIAGAFDRRYTPNLQQQAQELGISDRIKFLDYIAYNDLPKVLSQATALIFPSLWEGFGLPVLEAMACGTPVITSNLSSLPEVTAESAILINPYQTEEIAEAMKIVASDGQLRAKLSYLGLQRTSYFSWEKTGIATANLLDYWKNL
jgi:glycosyltransferase involved in cell wall biosynthesis